MLFDDDDDVHDDTIPSATDRPDSQIESIGELPSSEIRNNFNQIHTFLPSSMLCIGQQLIALPASRVQIEPQFQLSQSPVSPHSIYTHYNSDICWAPGTSLLVK